MGTDAAATVTEIEDVRTRLGHDLDALEARLPDRERIARAAAVSAGATVTAIVSLWVGWGRYRRARQRRELVTLLHEAGVAAHQEPPHPGGAAWRFVVGGAIAGAAVVGGYHAASRQLGAADAGWVEKT